MVPTRLQWLSAPSARRSHAASARGSRWTGRQVRGEVVRRVGGTARARVIVLFGLVLALNGADTATVGAIAPQLAAFRCTSGPTKIGLLSSVSLLVGAVGDDPGRAARSTSVKRIPMLSASIVLWSIASLLSAFAGSYSTLLLTRLLLGVVRGDRRPGDRVADRRLLPGQGARADLRLHPRRRDRRATPFGFIICGSVASAISWRAAFMLLAIPGFFLARELYRTVPEPLRGGQSHLEPGVEDLVEAAARARAKPAQRRLARGRVRGVATITATISRGEAAQRLGAEPDPGAGAARGSAHDEPVDSVRYVLSIPTNVLMIISSSLGYFFFSGLTTFALLFVRGHYHVGQATSELVLALLVGGALVGTLFSGWLADELLRRGVLNSRVWIPAVCYLGAAVLLIPGFVSDHLTPALWFDVAGAALLSAANPPLDAARLDIMPAGLWGRAESVRTVIRSLAQALAPLLFGGLAAADRRHRPASRRRSAPRHPAGQPERGARPRDHLPAAAGDARRRRHLTAARAPHLSARCRDRGRVQPGLRATRTGRRPPAGDNPLTRTDDSRTSRSSPERPEPRRSSRPRPELM